MDVVVGGPDVAAALLESREKLAPAVVVQVRSEKKFGVRQNYDKIASPMRSRTRLTLVTHVTLSLVPKRGMLRFYCPTSKNKILRFPLKNKL